MTVALTQVPHVAEFELYSESWHGPGDPRPSVDGISDVAGPPNMAERVLEVD
jgi:hypothetical protein